MRDGPELSERVMDESDGGSFGGSDVPASAKKVNLAVGIDPSVQMESQMKVQQGERRTGTRGRALLLHGFFPSVIGAEARGAADGGILSFDLPVKHDLCGGVMADLFVSQDCHQAFLQSSKAAFDLAFGLRAGSDQMRYAKGCKGALKLGTRIPVIGSGSMTKKAQAIGIDGHGDMVPEKESAKMLEVIPSCVGRDENRTHEFA